ncbi:MAG TPA: Gfo/Idh/MocA family oxidoreductase [Saprospiraceae bacterium]|nr:Gfo/Idh/MocA family oxidoreductase [Saprospiraceae bacterium]
MLKIGVLGAGHLGKIHLKCIQLASEHLDLVGFYDTDPANAEKVSADLGITAFDDLNQLIDAVDIIDIVTPTTTHYELAKRAIVRGKHLFIEKPITHTVEEAEELLELSKKHQVKVQVGHVERFNPALLALDADQLDPKFIEAHRLAIFNPRGTDVSVVLDLMIHDIDIILSMIDSEVSKISANGVAVVSSTPDIANARIEFKNGAVANVTTSRISMKQMRKVRLFQKDAYISLDFLEKQAQVIRMFDKDDKEVQKLDNLMELQTPDSTKYIHIDMPPIEPINAIKMELETFAESIEQNKRPRVSIEDGYKALKVAYDIIHEIEAKANSL